jgi:hypothetical protein
VVRPEAQSHKSTRPLLHSSFDIRYSTFEIPLRRSLSWTADAHGTHCL